MSGNRSSIEPCSKKAKVDILKCSDLSSDEEDADLLVSIWDTKPSDRKPKQINQSHNGNHYSTTSITTTPSSSGLNIQNTADFEPDNLTGTSRVAELKAMFPSVEEDVLQNYLVVYPLKECIQVISNFLYGGENRDDCSIMNTGKSSESKPHQEPSLVANDLTTTSSFPTILSTNSNTFTTTSAGRSTVSNSTLTKKSSSTNSNALTTTSAGRSVVSSSRLTKTNDSINSNTPTTTTAQEPKASNSTSPTPFTQSFNWLTKDGIAFAFKSALTELGSCISGATSPQKSAHDDHDKNPIYDFCSLSTSPINSNAILDWGGVKMQNITETKFPSSKNILSKQQPIKQKLFPSSLGPRDSVQGVTIKNESQSQHHIIDQNAKKETSGNVQLRSKRMQYYENKVNQKSQANNNAISTKGSAPITSVNTSHVIALTSTGKSELKTVNVSKTAIPSVGIDIRCGNNKVHSSMKRCYDQSAASKDIVKPYKRNSHEHKSKNATNSQVKVSSDHKLTGSQSDHSTITAEKSDRRRSTAIFTQALAGISNSKCSTSPTNKVNLGSKRSRSASSSNSKSPQTISQDKTSPKFKKLLTNWSSIPPSSVYAIDDVTTAPTPRNSNADVASLSSVQRLTNTSSSTVKNTSSPRSTSSSAQLVQHRSFNNTNKGKGPLKNHFTTSTSLSNEVGSQNHVTVKSSSSSVSSSSLANGNTMDFLMTSACLQSPVTDNGSKVDSLSVSTRTELSTSIESMSGELQSMVKNIMSKDDRLTQLTNQHMNGDQPVNKHPSVEEEEMAAKDMQSIQNETEILNKLFPETDPNYIFYKLEQFKNDPNRVARVNEQLTQKKGQGAGKSCHTTKPSITWSWLWEHEEKKDRFKKFYPFAEAESNCIELHFKKHKSSIMYINFKGSKVSLPFDFHQMKIRDLLTGRCAVIQRSDNNQNVKSSSNSKQPNGSLQPIGSLIEVFPGTSEFSRVESLLKNSIPKACVTKIQRIENNLLRQKYNMHYELLKQKNGASNVNIKELFHGTRNTPPSTIWNSEAGIDMRFSADNCMWGRGSYFAVHASYSHVYSFQKRKKGKVKYQMFLAHVLTGDSVYLDPNREIKKPPLNVLTGRDYDSINGITEGHPIYVLYNNAMSYPEYLITYKV